MPPLAPGQLVVAPGAPALGIGRLERVLPRGDESAGAPPSLARVFFYRPGRFEVLERSEVAPAPAGVWPPPAVGEAD